MIVILVDIATGRMTADGAIPDDRTLQSMRHGSPALPPRVGGLSPEQCGVLAALRDGARMWRQWSVREYGVPPCNSQYRAVEQETMADWSCAPHWKVVAFTLTEGQMACARITARAEKPRGSKIWLRLKEFVRRAKLDAALWGQYTSSRCHGGGSERKTAHHATDSHRAARSAASSAAGTAAASLIGRAAFSTPRWRAVTESINTTLRRTNGGSAPRPSTWPLLAR